MTHDLKIPTKSEMANRTGAPWPLPPGATIAILGGGQLGRMLALAAARLGLRCKVFADRDDAPAFDVASGTRGSFDDLTALHTFAAGADVLTYEFENVPVAAAEALGAKVPLAPSARCLEVAQDRLVEKTFIREAGLDVAPFARVDSSDDIEAAMRDWSAPAILKTRRFGYDGKGQSRLASAQEAAAAWDAIGQAPAILEKQITFACEVSVILVRDRSGHSVSYAVPRNTHSDGILRRSTVPSGLPADVEADAATIARTIADALDYVGVLAVELFDLGHGHPPDMPRLLVNEIAPRVHNSGHWTMDACGCDQFENHIRAIAGWPLGPTTRFADATMDNLIGPDALSWPELSLELGARLHMYGKAEIRPGRKMGHVNRIHRLLAKAE